MTAKKEKLKPPSPFRVRVKEVKHTFSEDGKKPFSINAPTEYTIVNNDGRTICETYDPKAAFFVCKALNHFGVRP